MLQHFMTRGHKMHLYTFIIKIYRYMYLKNTMRNNSAECISTKESSLKHWKGIQSIIVRCSLLIFWIIAESGSQHLTRCMYLSNLCLHSAPFKPSIFYQYWLFRRCKSLIMFINFEKKQVNYPIDKHETERETKEVSTCLVLGMCHPGRLP